MFIHGGYWQRNGKEAFAFMAPGPLAHGIDVALIGYTLAPEATLTGSSTKSAPPCAGCGRRVRRRARRGRLVRLGLVGWRTPGRPRPRSPRGRCPLAISGVFDLAPIAGTALDEALRLTQQEVEELSPIRLSSRPSHGTAAPLVIAYGADELPNCGANPAPTARRGRGTLAGRRSSPWRGATTSLFWKS